MIYLQLSQSCFGVTVGDHSVGHKHTLEATSTICGQSKVNIGQGFANTGGVDRYQQYSGRAGCKHYSAMSASSAGPNTSSPPAD